jgi:hypothetical protein
LKVENIIIKFSRQLSYLNSHAGMTIVAYSRLGYFNHQNSHAPQQELAALLGTGVQLRNQRAEDDYIQEFLSFQPDLLASVLT